MRLIDADEAIINFGFEWDDIPPTREEFAYFLKKQPTINAVPVVHGRWITTSGEVFPGSSILCYSHKHEECGFQYIDMNENGYDFCPNCGCMMDLED